MPDPSDATGPTDAPEPAAATASGPALELAAVGTAAIDRFLAARKVRPARDGERRRVAVALGEGDEQLQLSLESTPRTNGILARVAAGRAVSKERWPAALLACNHWNRRQPVARVVLVTGEERAGIVVEGWLAPDAALSDEQVSRFVGGVIAAARRVWTDPRVRSIAEPVGEPPAAE
jgi:hypothetical protein